MRVALGHESRVVVVVAPKRPPLKRRLHKWGQIALVKPKRVTAFITPKKKHQKTNGKTQSAKGSASIRLLRVRVIKVIIIIVIVIIIIIIKRSGTADERDFLTG